MMAKRCLLTVLLIMAGLLSVASVLAGDGAGDAASRAGSLQQEAGGEGSSGGTSVARSEMGLLFFVFVLAIFLGFELISKVPSQLHTPLMSGSNAISGITIVGALLAAGRGDDPITILLGVLAVAFAMINGVGGYLVTDRMLEMFRHKD